jgi:hypothetical protein
MNRARQRIRYGIAALLVVSAGMLAAFDVDRWPQYGVWLIGAAAGTALRTFTQTREQRPEG